MSDGITLDFGDYCCIEQKRYGAPNEMYQYKVIGRLRSNSWVDVPVQSPAEEILHGEIVDVIACVCAGVGEREILRYRAVDCKQHLPELPPHIDSRYPNDVINEAAPDDV